MVTIRVPYDRVVTDAQVKGVPVVAVTDRPVAIEIRKTWDALIKEINCI